MEVVNKKQLIVDAIKREYDYALKQYHDAIVKRAATIASYNAWQDIHKHDLIDTFDNLYNINQVDKNEIDTKNYLDRVKIAYDFAVETFLKD